MKSGRYIPPAPTCPKAHKMRFASWQDAEAAAIAKVKRDGTPLAVYQCVFCEGFHHTSKRGRSNRMVTGRRERPAWTQEKLDRTVEMVRDAKGIALTALFEYPKGKMADVLPVVQEANREGYAQLAVLARFELDCPELRAALDGLRPKLRAMEQLVRSEGKVDLTIGPVKE